MEINRLYFTGVLLVVYLVIIIFLISKRKYLGPHIWYFIISMVVVFLSEMLATVGKLIYGDQYNTTPFMAGGLIICFFSIILIYFYKILENPRSKNIQLAIVCANFINIILSLIYIEDFFTFLPYVTYFVTMILLLFSITLFFFETFNSEKIFKISTYYPVWIAISLIVLYLGVLPLIIISKNSIQLSISKNIFLILLYSVNFTGYAIMLTGIFFSKRDNLIMGTQ
ncbi:MAG: hypothetical protein ACXWVZ_02655 [Kaistella sp.]